MLQTLQRAYFEEGLDIGNIEVILQIADIFGLDKHEVEEKLQSGRMAIYLQSDYELAEHYEVKAVPSQSNRDRSPNDSNLFAGS